MFTSPYPDVDIPNVSIYDYLFTGLSDQELDAVALIDGTSGAETTYRALIAQIDGAAGALAARGVGTDTVVALLCPNSPAFAAVFHGILRAGATVTTINSLATAEDIEKQLRDSKATWFMTVSPLLAGAKAAAAAIGLADDHLIVLDGAEGHPSLRDLLAEAAPPPSVTFDPATHLAVLPYSSGTTGVPKGVMLSHRNLVANVEQSRRLITIESADRVLAFLPFFHIYGMTVLLNLAIKEHATLVTMPKFDFVEFLRIMQDHRCTYVFIAPPVAVGLAKHPLVEQYDISRVRMIFSGAAPLDGALAQAVIDRLDCQLKQGYGMTELSPVSHAVPQTNDDLPLDSVGFTIPNMECKLIDPETGGEIDLPTEGVSAPGELLCRGPNVMLGYLGNDEATRAIMTEDGFLRTGDIATVSSEGVVTIVDRLKELIKYKGYQIAPAELEALLLTHPAIADAAVIGIPGDEGQEVPKAFVVLQAGAELDEAGVMDFVSEHVAPYKKVRRVQFTDAIPKSSAGKILRKNLRAAERVRPD
ncbi:MAG TPA: AMP-binding protein [Terrimesophilobacter sp.]|nr:AMP-binding protein [Terrimesophilobacter sp.]